MPAMPLTEVMTLSGLNGSDPRWTTRFVNPPVVTPQWPQNLLQQTALGSIVKTVGIGGLGDVTLTDQQVSQITTTATVITTINAILFGTLAGIHGYRRNAGSKGWTAAWVALGATFPVVTLPVAIAQGFGKKG